jgi:tetratricopeptide (TPR) repeat protein
MRLAPLLVCTLMLPSAIALSQTPGNDLLAPLLARREAATKTSASDWAGADASWEKATALNPSDAHAWLELGRARYQEKKYLDAIEPLQRANDLGVSYPWDMPYFQACCYALGGKPDQAMTKLEEAINGGFRDLDLARSDEDLKSLHEQSRFHELVDDEDISKLDRNAGLTHDIRFYQRELKRLDYRERNLGGTGLDKFADQFVSDVPHLNENQVMVRFMQMGALAADGHTALRPPHDNAANALPVQFSSYGDGMFIMGATAERKSLIGAKLLAVDGHPVDEAVHKVSTLFGHENPQWVLAMAPRYLRKPKCLNGLGLSPSDKSVTLSLEMGGAKKEVTLEANTSDPDDTWATYHQQITSEATLCFRNRSKPFWYEYQPETKTVYFQYNAVSDDEKQKLSDFAKDMFAFIEAHDVDRMIVDARFNGGGNNFLNMPLLLGLIKSKVNEKGKLFVIIGKDTFSAAMCFVSQVERFTNAIFAGEPTGSSPNFIGESIKVALRYSKMQGSISDLYWQNSVAMDHRIWISPAIYVPPTFAAYSTNKDPVIDAIMAYQK